jgi:ATP-dependent Clp protease ATP-binding subunit ClpA
MRTIINLIVQNRPYGNKPVTLTQILHYAIRDQKNSAILVKYGSTVAAFNQSLELFIRVSERLLGSLAMTKTELDSVTRVVAAAEQLEKDHTDKEFECFLAAMYYDAMRNHESSHQAHFLINSGFNYDKFLDDFEKSKEEEETGIIKDMCVNLNKLAKAGKIDEVIGRDDEILRTIEILGKRKKNNPVLLGKAGVGKSAIAEGLALKIVQGDVPDTIKNGVVYNLEVANMVAGTSFRGQFEEKMMKLLEEFKNKEESGKELPILFIDEIHSIVGSGNSNGLDFANIIKPALARGQLRCMGATTAEEWQKFINHDKALKRRFSQIDIEEPTRDQTIQILKKARVHYEKKHGVRYTDESCARTVDLAMEFITDSALPDKAIDLFDLAGSIHKIKNCAVVDKSEIEYSLHRKNGIALDAIRSAKVETKQEPMAPKIKKDLFGQDHAVDKVVEVLEYSLAGMQDDNKPLGSFLFVGPTGVGKTELAKLLAREMKAHFERIDMSEFMEQHSVAKLIGAPPGYVGFDQGGRLTKTIEKNPRCVLLLDEMEKAHPRVQDILLQAMDNAKITDSQGNPINLKNVLILMTSNAGTRELNKRQVGFAGSSMPQKLDEKAINDFFTPEFRGRLNGVVIFNPLDSQYMLAIVDKNIRKLNETKLVGKGVIVTIDEAAKKWIVDKGYNPMLGARPIEETVKKYVHSELTKSILYGSIKEGKKKVSITVKDGELNFEYS